MGRSGTTAKLGRPRTQDRLAGAAGASRGPAPSFPENVPTCRSPATVSPTSSGGCRPCSSPFDVAAGEARIAELERAMSAPGFWDHAAKAQATIQELKFIGGRVKPVKELSASLEDAAVLHELAESEDDEDTRGEVVAELDELEKGMEELEFKLSMDDSGARFLPRTISVVAKRLSPTSTVIRSSKASMRSFA